MIIFLLLGLVLLAVAVALVARGVIVARLRTADTLGKIGHYGFSGSFELPPEAGLRGVLDSAAGGLGQLLTQQLRLISEQRLRKNLIAAGMYQTTPRQIIGYSLLCAVAQPNQAPARSRSDLAGCLVRLNEHLDQVLAIRVVALQAHDERHGPHLTPAGASNPRSGLS